MSLGIPLNEVAAEAGHLVYGPPLRRRTAELRAQADSQLAVPAIVTGNGSKWVECGMAAKGQLRW